MHVDLEQIRQELRSTGAFRGVYATPDDAGVLREILVQDIYKPLKIVPGDVVLDLGAHVGAFAKYAFDKGAKTVVCVEPNPEHLPYLPTNAPNGLLYWGAITRDGGSNTTLYVSKRGCSHSATTSPSPRNKSRTAVAVPTVSFRALLTSFRPTVVKMDIEGGEYSTMLPYVEELECASRVMAEVHLMTPEMFVGASELMTTMEDHGWKPIGSNKRPSKVTGWPLLRTWSRG